MQKSFFSFVVLTSLCSATALAEGEWVSLFDGKTLDQWQPIGLGKATYEVRDGAIYGKTVEGSRNTFLASAKQYGNFELEFEVKVHDKLNSGCQIRSREKTPEDVKKHARKNRPANDLKRFFGPQVEIEAGPGQSGFVYGEAVLGGGWRSKGASEKDKNPPAHEHFKNGEWNKFRIVAKGARIQTWVNDEQVEDLTDEEVYETHPKGHIGLQVHGIKAGTGPYDVMWKNIRIREL